MSADIGSIGLNVVRKVTDLWRASKSDSLIDYTKVARVEPIVLIDTDCMFLDCMHDVQQSLLNIFAGYYLQAIAVSTTVGRIDVMRHLEKFNPSRDPGEAAANSAGWLMAQESYRNGLPFYKGQTALEANPFSNGGDAEDAENFNDGRVEAVAGDPRRNAAVELKELADLSVGKALSVEITDGDKTASIPINIRLIASSMPTANLVHILSFGKDDTSMKERWHGWRSGRLHFVKDILLCNDIIEAHRKNLISDKDGVYTNIINRKRKNQLSTLLSGNPSVATASNMVVMSDTTLAELELKINGHFKDFKTRERIFDETSLMIAVVIHKSWERITIYHRGIAEVTQLGVRDMKTASKGSGPNVSEILKAYSLGQAPTL